MESLLLPVRLLTCAEIFPSVEHVCSFLCWTWSWLCSFGLQLNMQNIIFVFLHKSNYRICIPLISNLILYYLHIIHETCMIHNALFLIFYAYYFFDSADLYFLVNMQKHSCIYWLFCCLTWSKWTCFGPFSAQPLSHLGHCGNCCLPRYIAIFFGQSWYESTWGMWDIHSA